MKTDEVSGQIKWIALLRTWTITPNGRPPGVAAKFSTTLQILVAPHRTFASPSTQPLYATSSTARVQHGSRFAPAKFGFNNPVFKIQR